MQKITNLLKIDCVSQLVRAQCQRGKTTIMFQQSSRSKVSSRKTPVVLVDMYLVILRH